MRRFLSAIMAAVLLLSMVPASHAAPSEAQTAANALNVLGLFSGTGSDAQGNPIYELDRQPTRQEAITMLVKLVGGTEESAKGGWNTPFTDVDDWAKNWVGYAYAKGLTAGTSATTFGANDKTTTAQYLTFVLKALGYDANSDFSWDNAWSLAQQVGISNGEYNAQSTFTRGDMAIISHRALSAKLKGTDTLLGDVVFGSEQKSDYSLNPVDAAVLDISIQALEDATAFRGLDLVSRMYTHAFTCAIRTYIPDNAVALLADGTATDALKAMVVTCDKLTERELMSGDILFAGDDLYLYGAGSLRSLNGMGAPKVDTATTLASITDYTLLRPALALTHLKRSDMTATEKDVLTPQQEAVVSTAKAYWLRGDRLQYADTRFVKNGNKMKAEFRWQSTVNAPEDCTTTDWAYTNCAAFTYEVYYQTFGFKLPDNMYTTSNLAKKAAGNGTEVFAYDRAPKSTQTEEEKAKVKAEFLATLQPGDLACIRREDSSGHVLLYIGDGQFLHASGSTYKYTGAHGTEVTEASVRRTLAENYFFNPKLTPRGDVFSVGTKLSIIRPLNIINDPITENTKNRMANLEDIVAEKLSSHVRAQTADKGEEVTFTYALHNMGAKKATLNINETIPAELEWVSGGTRSGSTLTWAVEVPAGERIQVSYTARVKDTVPYGTQIQSTDSTVGGVTVKCEPITVGKKLTAAQQTALVQAYKTTSNTGLTGLALVNELYKQAIGAENIFADTQLLTVTEGENGCFRFHSTYDSHTIYQLNPDGAYAELLVPSLYGGYRLWASEFANDRTRLAKEQDLQIGDVLLCKAAAEELYLYLGSEIGFVNMTSGEVDSISPAARLERLLAYDYYYAVLRPMQALETAG